MGLIGFRRRARVEIPHQRPATKMGRRIATIPTHDLLPWIDTAISDTGRAVKDYERYHALDSLDDAEHGAVVVLELIRELQRRA
jgi:hypothetical protein